MYLIKTDKILNFVHLTMLMLYTKIYIPKQLNCITKTLSRYNKTHSNHLRKNNDPSEDNTFM